MLISRTSMLTGVTRTVYLNILPGQIEAYSAGALLQDAFPQLTAAEREFFKTGITEEEWDEVLVDI